MQINLESYATEYATFAQYFTQQYPDIFSSSLLEIFLHFCKLSTYILKWSSHVAWEDIGYRNLWLEEMSTLTTLELLTWIL